MATFAGVNDPSFALEQNLKCLTSNLWNLIDADEGVAYSSVNTSFSNYSLDTFNSMRSSSVEFDHLSQFKSDSSGYFSSSPVDQFPVASSTPLPPPPPGYQQIPFRNAPNSMFIPQMNGFNAIQFPTAAILPFNTPVSYVQTVVVPNIHPFPFMQGSMIGNNAIDCENSWKQSLLLEGEYARRSTRRGHSFHKKYPRRSEKDFTVVPQTENVNPGDEEIDLRKLKIGPDYLYQSEQTKLMNKFKKALSTLTDLANERQNIQFSVYKTSNEHTVSCDYTKNVSGYYQFAQYLKCILKIAKDEHKMAETVIQELEASCSMFKEEFDGRGDVVVKEMLQKTNRLVELESLMIIRGDELDVNRKPDEVKVVKDTLDAFILSVRNVAVDMWCLKVWYQGIGQQK